MYFCACQTRFHELFTHTDGAATRAVTTPLRYVLLMFVKRPPYNLTADEKALLEIHQDRQKDKAQLKSRRVRSIESPMKTLGMLIGSYFKADKQALRKIEEARAIMAWEVLVGDSAARVSKAMRVRGYQLVVRVSDPLWMTQLSYLKHDLIRKYQTDFPQLGIRDIFFVR